MAFLALWPLLGGLQGRGARKEGLLPGSMSNVQALRLTFLREGAKVTAVPQACEGVQVRARSHRKVSF